MIDSYNVLDRTIPNTETVRKFSETIRIGDSRQGGASFNVRGEIIRETWPGTNMSCNFIKYSFDTTPRPEENYESICGSNRVPLNGMGMGKTRKKISNQLASVLRLHHQNNIMGDIPQSRSRHKKNKRQRKNRGNGSSNFSWQASQFYF